MSGDRESHGEPIAIVGSACRFPGDATSPSKLWELLKEPRDVLTEIPNSRFNASAFYHLDGAHHGTSNVRHSYLLSDDHRLFDAQFFGTKPVEANSIDPQQRLLLETVYEGLESGGIPMEKLQGSNTGVYVGLMTNDYADLLGRDIQNFPTYFASGTARSILSNRISYFFDWHGPSMTIDTACSSSLIALHQAVQSLRTGESNVAVAAGTNLLLGPEQYVAESKLKMLSPTGRSRMWDKDANGYARGDGIAAVVLKPLSAALADGDHIECLVRETGINQDGRTKGITMPNPLAQADLIRETYARAGLDLSKPSDRPQYFEAHGTGTPAGDPVEAEAISTAFFGTRANYHRKAGQEPPLYVGSIKTVIGHTEGTAGLAAVLKASLALQHKAIPPNLLLNELNPAVRPFYNDLKILSTAREWPALPENIPRRASVNSFGFGGANAHAILEAFDSNAISAVMPSSAAAILTPFNFSASSEKSLAANLKAYATYLKGHPAVDLHDLSWTLNCRRSTLPVRFSVSASNATDLATRLENASQSPADVTPSSKTSSIQEPKLLGVFTGQGAQWARMGAELLVGSSLASKCIDRLDQSLQTLPEEHRPSWSLKDEILKDARSSRIGEALFSQSLCTAVQVMMVDLLCAAGIVFKAVVGHSSGEIAAAYASGYVRAEDAIRIAYYRGWSLQFAGDSDGVKGAMMAVGTPIEDAKELCHMPSLEGRICVAASNSSASVTLSGDADAIEEAKEIFEDEKKFARLLKVDKAYHSHHMLCCAAPYIEAIRNCSIQIQDRSESPTTWISSVYTKNVDSVNDSLTDTYWSNNMVNPVLFSEAVSFAVGALGPFDMAVEVGPHPALKGPALQTIQDVAGATLPYTGTLSRGKNSREAFASALGNLWISLGEHAVNFADFESQALDNSGHRKLLKDLPGYSWDHDRAYWHESRVSNTFRAGGTGFHHLLGVRCPDGTEKEIRWRNYLHTREIPWLAHHQVQGQTVFPAAGYISAAVEIIVEQYGLDSIHLIDFQDVIIGQALVLEESAGVEVIFALTISKSDKNSVTASFNCYSDAHKGTASMSLHGSAQITVIRGEPKRDALPPRVEGNEPFLDLDEERFYNYVSELGFGYTGPFRALSGLSRKMDEATGLIAVPDTEDTSRPLLVHPGSLDGAVQSIMLAYGFPGDGRLRTLYLPTKIDRIRINPFSCKTLAGPGSSLPFRSSVSEAWFSELSGDVDMYSTDGLHTVVQLQGLQTTPLSPPSSVTDVPIFTEVTWAPEDPAGQMTNSISTSMPQDLAASVDFERIALFYLKNLLSIPEPAEVPWNHRHLLTYAEHCVSTVKANQHPFGSSEWAKDTFEDISKLAERHPESIDIKALKSIGEALPAAISGETNLLEVLIKDNLLSQFYTASLGIETYHQEVARMAGQISNKYPHINVLEIGSGAGETTEPVLNRMDTAFSTYTFTDISEALFDVAQEKFDKFQSRMAFKVLDIEKDVTDQGYGEESFDLVIASLALYATKNLEATLSNIRRLIRPGGYLLFLELTDPNVMRFGLVLGGLPGWWLGHQEGRTLSPCVPVEKWGQLLQNTGFSGVDASLPGHSSLPVPFSVILAQAVDDRVSFLRNPLVPERQPLGVGSLTIIGGKTSLTASLIPGIQKAASPHYERIELASTLADISVDDIPVMGTVLSLTELDEPTMVSMTLEKLKPFQELFKQSKNILWVGYGAQGDNPFGNMFTGVQRTLHMEMTHLRVQFLNFHQLNEASSDLIAKKLLHLGAADVWEQSGQLQDLLWYTEPQLSVKNGEFIIPRFRLNRQRNDRYNSSRRLIMKSLDRETSTVTIQRTDHGYQVFEADEYRSQFLLDRTEIQVTNSLLRSVMVTDTDNLFLVAGEESQTGDHVIALSETLESRIRVPKSWIIHCERSKDQSTRSMLNLYLHFLAQSTTRNLNPGATLAVLDPDFSIAAVMKQYAALKGLQLILFTTKESSCSKPWIHIHPHCTRRELARKIPPNICHLLNIEGNDEILDVLRAILPADCQIETEQTLTRETSQLSPHSATEQIAADFQATWKIAHSDHMPVNEHRLRSFSLKDIIENQRHTGSQSIITWEWERLPFQVQPATKAVRFAKDKTYWLIGLTAGLGLSLCQWMARQGARYIALSSRNPKIDNKWLRQMAQNGCNIRVFANDITNRDSVHATYRNIIGSMPPIAGVAQGAMVLQDAMFLDLDLPRLEKVLRPKVEGSILLDELFSENTLDFMIFFSSMAAMTGNPGQVAYNAANMFMASLAAQRQKRGLAGHAINIGAIVGNGYVTRELNMGQQSYLYKVGHSWMSEQDFHEVFAEGVLSCLKKTGTSELCSGLRIDDDDTKGWISNPMFQHLVIKSNAFIAGEKKSKAGVMVKSRLLESTSMTQVMDILQEAFTIKLQSALQTDPSMYVLGLAPDELGIDSLVAVDIRSWFLKELSVDIPVLKIFNAASIQDLLDFAATLLPESLISNVKGVSTTEENANSKAVEPASLIQPVLMESPMPNQGASDSGNTNTQGEPKAFNIDYIPSMEDGGASSSVSMRAGDSSSEQNDDTSSSSSIDNDMDTLPKRGVEKAAPMSFGQSRFWFLKSFVEDQTAFNVTPTFELKGKLRVQDFARAVQVVGQRHEALRTFFFAEGGKHHMQGVWKTSALRLEHSRIADEKEVEEAAQQMKSYVFDIAQGEILRIQLLSLSPERHWIVIGFHHINMDGISFEVFWSDLEKVYNRLALSHDFLQYPDFTLRQLREYDQGTWADDLTYWYDQFDELPSAIPLLPFALRSVRPGVSSFGSNCAPIRLEKDVSDAIDQCCRLFKVTPFHFYLATWQALLLRFFDLDYICVGLGDANRTDTDVLNSVGLFLNLLPIKFSRKTSQSFGEALKDTRSIAQNASAHSRVPFDVILTELNVPRSASHSPLFQVFFNYRQKVEESREFCGCTAKGTLHTTGETSYDLQLDVGDLVTGETIIHLLVQKELYGQEHAELLLRSYCNLLRAFVQNPAIKVTWPSLFMESDIQQALSVGRGPELEVEWPATIVHRVDDIAKNHPEKIALKQEDGPQLTYQCFQDRVATIADELLIKGVTKGSRIGVFQSPSIDLICSLIALLRAGASYVPLEKKVGLDRLAAICSEAKPSIILIDSTTLPDVAHLNTVADIVNVEAIGSSGKHSSPILAEPEGEAVVMFTSGSTGVPKGISINHSSYMQQVHACSHTWAIQEGKETILHQSSYAWDMSLYQMLICLCNGGTLVIANSKTRGDPVATSKLIALEKVSTVFATPTEYLVWAQHGRSFLQQSVLTTAICGGEFMSNGLLQEFRSLGKPELRLINAYGPAETTISCSTAEVNYRQVEAPVATPLRLYTLPNYSVYIVDDELNPVPVGVPGEVIVGGAGVAQGYLSDDKTRERFLTDRHASQFFVEKGWTKMHRTGDWGRLSPDGGLVLLGRIDGDNQIKLGGIRINIEEIEATIVQGSAGRIRQAVVSARPGAADGQQFLVAFVVITDSNPPANPNQFLTDLASTLPMPQYMRPAAMIPISSIPQTTSGKIDRPAVSKLSIPQLATQKTHNADLGPLEEAICQLWQEVLPKDLVSLYSIQPHSDFFHVGGSSLSLVNLQELTKNRLHVSVPLHWLFESSTLRGMASRIQNMSNAEVQPSVDWEEEISNLLTSTLTPSNVNVITGASEATSVVLTGATGFMGKEILQQLVADDKVQAIYCLATRKARDQLPDVFSDSKVHVFSGNLGAPQLGLSDSDAVAIFSRADVVIHNGADVSFMKSYQSLKLTNVASTVELVKLALLRHIPFHFISSASTTRLALQPSFGESSLADYPPPIIPQDGYTAAKWVSEVYLERVNQKFGLPVWIHRPSSVSGTDAPELDLMSNVMRYCQETKKIPDSSAWSGVFDLISVESAASQIICFMHISGATDAKDTRFVYESGEIQLGQDEVQSVMEVGTGHQFTMVSVEEWVDHAEKAGMSPLLGMYLRRTSEGQVLLPRLVKGD
ncbi:hypothetical protein N7492_009156 [Penicillium capsulatum]|uniref:Uncharacterized protein n=1 Tax=Penicillium capsulatum TaxID=69766 RepID=A0A9W9HR34_9EURO|nr:hypothetical protein N7492_009156 [Penicillium capsulatum]KAJ6106555.1 hypothetical protein N7512_010072 [Penicillium capsulatum]